MEEVLPKNFEFDKPLKVAAAAESHRITLTPISGTSYTGRGRIIFNLPSGSNGMYFNPTNTYLQYTLRSTVLATTAFTLDASGYSPIQSINVFFGSVQVSQVTDVHLLGNMLIDHTCSMADRGTSLTPMGCADMVGNVALQTPRNGRAMALAANSTIDIAIPLIGLFGPGNCTKAIPLSLLRDDIRIEITLNPIFSWVTGAPLAEGNVVIEQVKLQAEVIRLDSAVEQQLIASVPKGVMSIPATDILCYSTTVAAGAGSISWQIPCRAKSVQSAYIVLSSVANSTGVTIKSSSTFTRAGLSSYSFRIGGLRVPSIPVSNTVEMRSELYKAMRVLNASNNPSSVTQAQYEGEAFAIGLGLDSFQHEGMLLDGKSLASSSGLLFEATLAQGHDALQVFCYVMVDSILTVNDGLLDFTN
jgi:hypothetical protein